MFNTLAIAVLAIGFVLVAFVVVQVWRRGGIDKNKVKEVVHDDAQAVQDGVQNLVDKVKE